MPFAEFAQEPGIKRRVEVIGVGQATLEVELELACLRGMMMQQVVAKRGLVTLQTDLTQK